MPVFHCPMGAPFYGEEGCIECGMCYATTKEEVIEASNKLKEYLSSEAAQKKKNPYNKIAICGKGGVGKSTTVTLIADGLTELGYVVLTIDSDESNPGLHRMFGFDKQPKPLIKMLDRFSIGETKPDTEWLAKDVITMGSIPAEYIVERDGLKFMMVGKIEDPLQGCACTMADMVRVFMDKVVLGDGEFVVIDMEAGVESFGRGVERSVNTVLVIVEPSFESMAIAEKINYMASGIGVAKVWAILNKVPSKEIDITMKTELIKKGVSPLGTIFYDPQVNEAGFQGRALGDSKAKEDVRRIIQLLLK